MERTLNFCVESITRQRFRDFEIILVDDGSPDNCPKLVDEWTSKDGRIRAIHKQNGGLSSARNAGIERAKGQIIMFVDSDDALDSDSLEPLMDLMAEHQDIDFLEFPVSRFYGNDTDNLEPILNFPSPYAEFTDMKAYWTEGQAYMHTYAWNKVYRRHLFENVRFPEGKVFEDIYTLPSILANSSKIATTNKGLYLYRINPKGITSTAQASQTTMLLEANLDALKHLFRGFGTNIMMNLPDSLDVRRLYMHIVDIQLRLAELETSPPLLPEYKVKLSGLSPIHKLKASAINTIGLTNLCRLNRAFRKIFPRKQ